MIFALVTFLSLTLAVVVVLLYLKEKSLSRALSEDLWRALQEKEIVIEFLHKSAEQLADNMDNQKLYSVIVRATALGCGAMSACIYERNPDGSLSVKAVEGLFPPQTKKVLKAQNGISRTQFLENIINDETVLPNEGIIGAVARDAKGILIVDAQKDPRVIKHEDSSLNSKSLIAVPLYFAGKLHGVLAVANPIDDKNFSDIDFSLAQSLGEQAGLMLHHRDAIEALLEKNKLTFDLKLASSVQRYLLPANLPQNSNVEFGAKYIPQQLIGGDFYDCFELPDGRIAMVIGDVSGKGISAAIIMAICQTKLRYLALHNPSPAQTLIELNREIVSSMRLDMFATIIYAIIEKDSSKITFARAGHEKPLIYKASQKKTVELKGNGMAVGMVPSEIFDNAIEDYYVDFEKGDIFLIYTDGITESENFEGEEYSTARLASALSELATLKASEIPNALVDSVRNFTQNQGSFKDDLTMIEVKRT